MEGFQEITDLQSPASLAELNRMLKRLFDTASGDGESVKVLYGYGTPENNVVASVGALYLRKDGGASTSLYVKESGSSATGWVAK